MLNITAHGNIGKDPEIKKVGDMDVAQFSLAARTGKDETTWIDCAVWGKRAQVVSQYLHKGDKVTVAGSGSVKVYQKKDGTEGRSLQLRVSDFTLPPKEKQSEGGGFDF
jgi:single-strand DNA-binding protein